MNVVLSVNIENPNLKQTSIYRKTQARTVDELIQSAKLAHFSTAVFAASTSEFFHIVNKVMYKDSSPSLPQHTSSVDLADRFNDFFVEKVQTIRDDLPTQEGSGAKLCSLADASLLPV